MQTNDNNTLLNMLVSVIISFVAVLAFFYGLDHLIMSMQGLPLNLDLSPAG
ncbi:MAG: hypothetical protein KUF77_06480 [Candidatus Thiodiazotropha sp. (ex Lucina aurantia)]|uniref:Uncharacterized protein n=2 Tax=Candidatus Thiodiazotropha TaxID=1913444 RepID=A0A7Z0VPX9_9GAMM|nr:hypothetical protein [Candidatus Thiodiazotropha endolucinida]MBT3012228.1 hypothetical protein [Candidatus Thiodiazotropha sp. (ex Lucina pensylvanica)]MBT3016078.1 hypothetical protein [Candidatus Thiodiazotropha taylori]MBT3038679.1 hypothetical protein [Candidatus Thiodiazotropha sp. (ex Codakia orbicularis)]MBV2102655.1 hypothetical protein [Candidatus Thiodiazotropha sp. (ex Lucina aurantia)]MBT3023015.1 hypothetical protein [Candidatus Thiodiazotropha taylori]